MPTPITVTDWLNASEPAIRKALENAVLLPTFTQTRYDAGNSANTQEVVLQYNFTVSRDFVIKNIPTVLNSADFVLCVKFRVGTMVYRWQLNEPSGSNIPNVEMYAGQPIGANFVLEIWNLPDTETVSNAAAVAIKLSIRTLPDDFRTVATPTAATGQEILKAALAVTNVTRPDLSANITLHHRSEAIDRAGSIGPSSEQYFRETTANYADKLYSIVGSGNSGDSINAAAGAGSSEINAVRDRFNPKPLGIAQLPEGIMFQPNDNTAHDTGFTRTVDNAARLLMGLFMFKPSGNPNGQGIITLDPSGAYNSNNLGFGINSLGVGGPHFLQDNQGNLIDFSTYPLTNTIYLATQIQTIPSFNSLRTTTLYRYNTASQEFTLMGIQSNIAAPSLSTSIRPVINFGTPTEQDSIGLVALLAASSSVANQAELSEALTEHKDYWRDRFCKNQFELLFGDEDADNEWLDNPNFSYNQ